MNSSKKLYKNKALGKLEGVCAGFTEYFDADVTLVRVFWILVTLMSFGLGFVGYIACAIVMPDKSKIID
ncbi:PspC domain-containing protein [Clostridium sp. LP20]|uniref:PspC domain-containing protein n=1 Tax=Clostridium sp. LP20 TaxID=3418665 RepID=UPI003EE80DC0